VNSNARRLPAHNLADGLGHRAAGDFAVDRAPHAVDLLNVFLHFVFNLVCEIFNVV
jgi:hypothetical protein